MIACFAQNYAPEAIKLFESSFLDETFVQTILHFANEPKMLIAESHQRELPVLSDVVRPPSRSVANFHRSASEELTVVRYAVSEAGLQLPRIATINRLLELQNDERVLSFRHQMEELITEIRRGNFGSVHTIHRRIKDSARDLQTISKIRRRLHWTFLLPIATSVFEIATGMLPAASFAFSLGLAGGDFALARKEGRHKWVWLCSQQR